MEIRLGGLDTVGVTALLAEIDPSHGELKSMRTSAAQRGRGVGTAVLTHLLGEARRRGYSRVLDLTQEMT